MNVLVVGAGPAGLRTAEVLAENGVSVSVFERSRRIERKVCSGLLSARTVRRYGLVAFAENSVDGARIHAGNIEISVERKRVAYVLNRQALDSELLARAESAGADVYLGREWRGESADALAGADGFASSVRARLGLRPPRFVMGAIGFVRGHFDGFVDIYLDPEVAPGFFAWQIPRSDSEAEIGLGVSEKHSSTVFHRLRRFATSLGYSELRVLGARPIPVDLPLKRVIYDGHALVGDAAVQTKATTGGGISYGLLAADALASAILSGDLAAYQRFHRRRIFPRLFLHYLIRRYLDRVDPERLLHLVHEYGMEAELSRRGDMDDPFFLFSPKIFAFIFRSAALLI